MCAVIKSNNHDGSCMITGGETNPLDGNIQPRILTILFKPKAPSSPSLNYIFSSVHIPVFYITALQRSVSPVHQGLSHDERPSELLDKY